MLLRFLLPIIFACSFFACRQNPKEQYLFIGHAYDWKAPAGNRVDPRIAALDLSKFDMLWLGGDICSRTSERQSTLEYLDSLLHISSPTTLWAVGNHDLKNGTPHLIQQKTNRPLSYATHHKGITCLILNTNLGHPQLTAIDSSLLCQQLNRQYKTLQNVADTIRQSSYLILLHHHALLSDGIAKGTVDLKAQWHYVLPQLRFSCTPNGSFEELAYPLLVDIQNKGIQVILVGGDIGQRAKKFAFQSNEGIWFLGSGINNSMDPRYVPEYVTNQNPDSLLTFEYDLKNKKLTWYFWELPQSHVKAIHQLPQQDK
ncbi:MAG TPA: hypothetical protein ENJ45_03525 [Phaeodactylibacter sp.]|nr:hypothetical protein [Phaeodactylibacter sp.]